MDHELFAILKNIFKQVQRWWPRLAAVTLFLSVVGGSAALAHPGFYGEGHRATYAVTYDGNGNDGGTVPLDEKAYPFGYTVTVIGNTGGLVKDGYVFAGWNSAADGSGSALAFGDTFTITDNVTLFAQWEAQEPVARSEPEPRANPGLANLSPADDIYHAAPRLSTLVATFDQTITLSGTGTVTVTDLDDGTDTETFTLPDARVSANGNDLSIEMDGDLEVNTRYSVRISSDAVTGFGGINDDTTWNFRTVKMLHNVVIATIQIADAVEGDGSGLPHKDIATCENVVLHDAINVDEAMRIASYGEIGLNVIQTIELQYLDVTPSETTAGDLRLRAENDPAVQGARFRLFVMPSSVAGSSGGAASIGGTWSTYKTFNYDVVLHELGHCLGGQHSFQDPGCVLGWAPVNYAAEKKALFGWLDNDNFPASLQSIVDVTSATDLTLVPLSTHPEIIPGTRMARVFRPDGGRFNISYRVSSPPFSSLSSGIYSEKVSVRYDVGNTLTYGEATLGAGESHANGFFKVTCLSVATDGSSADVRIEFVEPSMNFNPTTAIVAEGADGATTTATATVTLSHDYTETVTVQHALAASPGTAQSGVDYNYTPGTISFAPGETTQSFTFEVIDNALTDGDRTVVFEISPDTNVVAGTELNLTYTILDDEGNVAPVWDSSPLVEINGAKDEAYTSSLADHASDSNNDALTFAKVDGPDWLTVGSDGSLSGTPGAADSGLNTFTVSVTDLIAAPVEVSLEISVDANASPRFAADSFSAQTAAVPGEPFTSTIAGSATDVNGDPLTYAKVDGPDWLSVAADGSLSGTPSNTDIGVNTFTVSVTDGIIVSPVEATFTLTVIDRATGVTVIQSDVIGYSSGNRIVYAPVDILNANSVLVAAIYAQGTIEEETLRFGNGGGIGSGDVAPDWVTEDADGRYYMAYWLNPPTDSGLAIRTTNNASGTSAITYITAIWELANVNLASAVVKSENSDSITTTADNQFIVAGAGLNGDFAILAVAGSALNLPLRFDSVTLASLGIGGGGGTLSGGDTMAGSAGTYNVGFEGQDFETQGYGPIALAFSPGGTPLSHSVTYDGNGSDGGSVPDDPSDPYVNGATVTVLDNTGNLFRNGYTFDGWNTAADGSGAGYAAGATFDILTATTLYAQWLGTPYTLTFDANGGDTPVPASKTVNLGSAYGSLATTSRTGYTFDGWFTAASGGSEVTAATTVTTEADHTLYARWTINPYTITFDSAGGSAVDPITQDYGTAVSAPADPTRGGYVFTGWSPALPATIPAADQTVTAQWTFGTPEVSVSASDADASETGPDTGTWTITRAGDTAPALDVYFSLGGTATLTDDYALDATSPVTLPAGESSVTVTLTPVDDTEVEGGDETALLTIDSNAAYSIGTASDTIIIGDNEPVTLVYDGNGSDGGAPPTDGSSPYTPGSTVTVLGPGSLTRSGYSFAGWNTAADGSGITYAANDTFTITGNVTLYARWRAPASIAWITDQLAINSGWQNMLEAAGHSVTYFGASYATLDATEAATLNTYDLVIAAGDADLGTGWERVSVPMINLNPYRINELGWSSTEGSLTSQGMSVSVLDASDPIWNGMGLSNGDSLQLWTTNVRFNGNAVGNLLGSPSHIASKAGDSDDVGIVRWGIGALPDGEGPRMQWRSPASGDLDAFTLTADGQTAFLNAIDDFINPEASFTVTYDGNGSEAGDVPVDGSTYASGATVTVLGNTGSLTKSGYSFNNWNTDSGGNGTAYAAADTFAITEDTTLYAQWTVNSAGFTLSQSVATVVESGGTDTFTVVLVSQPASDVVFDLTSSDTNEATVSPATLTFSSENWNTPQTVTLTGVNDDAATNDSATITVSVNDSASLDTYDALADQSVFVTCTDDDNPAVQVGAISGSTAEDGTLATFTVVLATQPTASVTLGFTSSDTGEGTVSPDSLTFGTGDWNIPQSVTVTGVDDSLADGDQIYTIVTAAASSSDADYQGINPADVSVINLDNEFTLTVVAGSGGASVTGAGTKDPSSAPYPITATAATGYSFGNWSVTAGSATFADANSASTTVSTSADATVQANFTPETYLVTYDGNTADAGTPPEDQTKYHGVDLTLDTSSSTLTKAGFRVAGWNTKADGSGDAYFDGGTYTVNAPVTLFAQWVSGNAYTWDNGGADTNWETDANWAPDGTKPGAGAAGDAITFNNGGAIGENSTPRITVSDITWTSDFSMNSIGDWTTSGDGIAVDTGSAADAIWQSNGRTLTFDYVNFTLNSNLVLRGGGRINMEPGRNCEGSGGFIVEDGTLYFQHIHETRADSRARYTYSGGIEIMSNGNVGMTNDNRNHNFILGDGLITIWEGGNLAAHNSEMDQNVQFNVTSAGANPATNPAFISGGGASLNFTGDFSFDLSGAGTAVGNQWAIVTATATYDAATFSVTGFSEVSPGVWTGTANGVIYQFEEATGILSVLAVAATSTVTYDGNGSDGGDVPVDGTAYANGATVTVLGNTGGLTLSGSTFAGWNTQADGLGTAYVADDTFTITENTTLYAQWTSASTYADYAGDNGGNTADPTADGNSNGVQDGVEYAFYEALGAGVKLESPGQLGQVLWGTLDAMGTPNDTSDDRIKYSVLLPETPPADVIYRVYASSVAPGDSGKTLLATYSGGSWTLETGVTIEAGAGSEDVIVDTQTPSTSARRFVWLELEIDGF